MICPDQIHENIWRTAMSVYHKAIRKSPETAWQQAIAAALNAWPKSYSLAENDSAEIRNVAVIILPMPQGAGDE